MSQLSACHLAKMSCCMAELGTCTACCSCTSMLTSRPISHPWYMRFTPHHPSRASIKGKDEQEQGLIIRRAYTPECAVNYQYLPAGDDPAASWAPAQAVMPEDLDCFTMLALCAGERSGAAHRA